MKKVLSAILAIIMVFSLTTIAFATDTSAEKIEPTRSVTIATAYLKNFYYTSNYATLTLSQTCNYVSVKATCSSGTDSMILVIQDISTGTYNTTLPFTGGSGTVTFHRTFGAGSYNIYMLGGNVLHPLGMVAFST